MTRTNKNWSHQIKRKTTTISKAFSKSTLSVWNDWKYENRMTNCISNVVFWQTHSFVAKCLCCCKAHIFPYIFSVYLAFMLHNFSLCIQSILLCSFSCSHCVCWFKQRKPIENHWIIIFNILLDIVATQSLVNYLSLHLNRGKNKIKRKINDDDTWNKESKRKKMKMKMRERKKEKSTSRRINGLTSRVNNHKASYCDSEVAHKLLYKRRNQR